jgi:hypothetical protein
MIQNTNCFPVEFYPISKLNLVLEKFLSEIHITVPLGTACRDSGYKFLAFTGRR